MDIRKVKSNLNSNIVLAIGINLIFIILALAFCDIKYEVSDDFIMATIMSGAYGYEPNPQMIFMNTILGYLMIPFYKLFPAVSWYFVFQMLLCFVTFVLVVYMLLEKLDRFTAILLSVMLLTFFSDDIYILPQFTKTAALAIMGGGVVFLWTTFREKRVLLQIISGCVCLLGAMVRKSGIYLAGPYILLLLIFEFYFLFKTQWKAIKIRGLICKVLPGILLIFSIIISSKINDYTYYNDEPSKLFRQYTSARAKIVDSKDYGYEVYADKLREIGISENDYYVIRSWNFADNNFFDLEKMKEVAQVIAECNAEQKQEDKLFAEHIYEDMQVHGILNYPITIACILLFFFSVIFQKKIYSQTLICICGIALETYFFVRGRVVYRVEYGVFLGIFLGLLYLWDEKNNREIVDKKEKKKICILILLFLCVRKIPLYIPDNSYKKVSTEARRGYIDGAFNESWNYDPRKYRKVAENHGKKNELLEEIETHKENFYFMDFGATIQNLYYEWSPFENLPTCYYDNSAYLTGVTTNHPGVSWILDMRRVNEPLPSLVNDNVYLVDNWNLDKKLNYLREHYYPNARAELYKELSGYQIWKVYRE